MINDRWLVAGCLLGLVCVGFALVRGGAEARTNASISREAPFGALEYVHQGLRRRPARALAWENLASGDVANARDTLYVPPGASAVLRTNDGARLVLEESTLVVLESASSVALAKGSLTAAAEAKLEITSPVGKMELAQSSVARLEREQVAVLSGQALVATSSGEKKLEAAQRARADGSVGTYASVPRAPIAGARIYCDDPLAAIELTWDGQAARVQISAGPDFAQPLADTRVQGQTLVWRSAGRGMRYWRLVSEAGAPISTISSFALLDNSAPLPLGPRHLEQVTAPPPKSAVRFLWTPVEDATSYTLELARDPSFQRTEKSVTVERPHALLFALPEGVYSWRVQARGPLRPSSPYSAVRSFRLTHKALVGAPELFDAEVELHAP